MPSHLNHGWNLLGSAILALPSIAMVTVQPAQAEGPTFATCPAQAYITQGVSADTIKLNAVNLLTGSLTRISRNDFPGGVNAIGFSRIDAYMYGIKGGTSNVVVQVDSDGVGHELRAIANLPADDYVLGDVDDNGVLYVKSLFGTKIYGIDVNPDSPNYLKLVKTITGVITGIQDFAFHPTNGKLYTIQGSSAKVYEISWPANGATVAATITDRGKPAALPMGSALQPYGAIYFAVDNSMYGYRNGSAGNNDGEIYRLTKVESGSGTPIAQVLTTTAAGVTFNDGARCPLAPPIYPANTADYGDAPDPDRETGAGNYKTRANDNGAVHEIVPGLSLGGYVDGDSGNLQGAGANGDDQMGTPDDEEGVGSFATLTTDPGLFYSVTVSTTNTTGQTAYLVGYIDFNKDGDFEDTGEQSSTKMVNGSGSQTLTFTTPTGMTPGKTYARFRLGQIQGQVESSFGPASSGEVEDYPITITASSAQILVVKRITAINGDRTKNPNDNTPLNVFVDNAIATDNHPYWPNPMSSTPGVSSFLRGVLNAGKVGPGDRIEYTIYFLNAGGSNGDSFKLCDRITGSQSLLSNAYGTNQDIQLHQGNGGFTTWDNAATVNLTSAADSGDRAQLMTTSSAPSTCNLNMSVGGPTDTGTLVIDITGTGHANQPNWSSLAASTTAGGSNTYGFVRFTTQVKP